MATAEAPSARLRPEDVEARRFALARRGYDPEEVHPYLAAVARYLGKLEEEVRWLRAKSEQLDRRNASATEAAYARLAREWVAIVRKADQAAEKVKAGAQAEARHVLESAHREAERLVSEARRTAAAKRAKPETIVPGSAPADAREARDGPRGMERELQSIWAREERPKPTASPATRPSEVWRSRPNGAGGATPEPKRSESRSGQAGSKGIAADPGSGAPKGFDADPKSASEGFDADPKSALEGFDADRGRPRLTRFDPDPATDAQLDLDSLLDLPPIDLDDPRFEP